MKAINRNRNIVAATLAVGLGLAANGAFAMTSEHDTVPAIGKASVATDTNTDTDRNFVRVGGRVDVVYLPAADK